MEIKSKHHQRHRNEWLGLVLVLLGLGILLGLDLYASHRETTQVERARLLHEVNVVTINLSRRLQTTSNALDAIRQELRTGGSSNHLLNQRLSDMVAAQTGVRTILLINAKGDAIASSRPELIGQNFRGSERYTAIRQTANPALLHLSTPFVTPLGTYAMSVGKMVEDRQGRFGGYVLAILDPEYFSVLLESVIYAPDVHATLVHGDGKVVFRAPDTEKIIGVNLADKPGSLFKQFLDSGHARDVITGLAAATQVRRMIAFATISPLTVKADKLLVVAIDRDLSVMFSPWLKDLELRAALFGVIAMVTLAGLYLYQRRHLAFERLEEAQEDERLAMEKRILQINAELEHKVRERTAELEKANEGLRHLSRHDVLTGLANRMAANEHLHSEFMRMKRTGSTYAVLMLDVDYFKRINDSYGHEAGDHVLKRVAKTLNHCLRETDFVARFGGEEFIVLLPDTNLVSAAQVAEKIRRAVEASVDPIAGHITISIGVAVSSPENHDESAAVNLADDRLYAAKNAGRNRVVSV
ncbi:MAG: diguanylate cyclase [Burkholderiales bacterium]|nr:diguanylate cyclase [Burkholderiales bacterium]